MSFATVWAILKSILVDQIYLKSALAIGVVASTVYAGHWPIIELMIMLYVVDFVTGFILAASRREISSGKFFKGSIKLGVYCILILIAYSLDSIFYTKSVVQWLMLTFIIVRDCISILENLQGLGYEVPEFLVRYLKVADENLKDRAERMIEDLESARAARKRK